MSSEQDVHVLRIITTDGYKLEVVNQFTYLGSTINSGLNLDTQIDKRIGKTVAVFARLTTQALENTKLSIKTKMAVYNPCVISTLLYWSETWTTYVKQKKGLNTFHLKRIRRILGASWKD